VYYGGQNHLTGGLIMGTHSWGFSVLKVVYSRCDPSKSLDVKLQNVQEKILFGALLISVHVI
jgi:hypothetical protein